LWRAPLLMRAIFCITSSPVLLPEPGEQDLVFQQ
jgi:hypothetical protein